MQSRAIKLVTLGVPSVVIIALILQVSGLMGVIVSMVTPTSLSASTNNPMPSQVPPTKPGCNKVTWTGDMTDFIAYKATERALMTQLVMPNTLNMITLGNSGNIVYTFVKKASVNFILFSGETAFIYSVDIADMLNVIQNLNSYFSAKLPDSNIRFNKTSGESGSEFQKRILNREKFPQEQECE